MFEDGMRERAVLNWRGPLLSAGVFAAGFAILLLMAYQNQATTSDLGSSLREDPYGTSLLFDSYRRAGYQVRRSQDPDSLADQNASQTTAFFIGGRPTDWKMDKGKPQIGSKFLERLEGFLAHGGRVVLIHPAWRIKSEAQGWEVEEKWSEPRLRAGPAWISPDPQAMPSGSERMYLAGESPWLETDAGWSVLYSAPASSGQKTDAGAHVHMARRKVGDGELIVVSQESFLLNEAIKTRPNPVLLDFLAGGRPMLWVDETLHGLRQEKGVLWLVQRYRLQIALLLFWAASLVLLWSMSGDLVARPSARHDEQVILRSEGAGAASRRLLQRSIPSEQVVSECWEQFRRRSPEDAQAIAGDEGWGVRLRFALTQPPLQGYRELSQIIAERRVSARALARTESPTRRSSTITKMNDGPEEAGVA